MDQAIVDYLKETRNFLIDLHTAETTKVRIGEAYPAVEKSFLAEGVDSATGLPGFVEVSSGNVREALSRPLRIIIDTVNDFLNNLPSALYVDILDRGITLAGGGSLLRGIDRLLERNILMPVLKSKDPLACLVLGTGSALPYLKEYRQAQGAKGLSLPAPPVIKR
jgi:rod shape-determining protein MreB